MTWACPILNSGHDGEEKLSFALAWLVPSLKYLPIVALAVEETAADNTAAETGPPVVAFPDKSFAGSAAAPIHGSSVEMPFVA